MFDKKQKGWVKRIHLVTDDGLYDRKTFYTVIFFFLIHLNKAIFPKMALLSLTDDNRSISYYLASPIRFMLLVSYYTP